jgi:dipeptidyl aminopeptidase/acylaminoacyl peptidase
LRARRYGGDGIKSTRVVFTNEAYKQVLIEYFSDGLKITGTMNVPRGIGPFPVVILDHGYFKPAEYKTGDGTNRAADAFARHGYLTLAPDYRCYVGSQCGGNPLYVGYAIDVLNLLAQVSSLPDADPARVGIWGHSMGGGITLRVLAITNDIKVAALYGALTGDDEVQYCWLQGCRVASVPTPESRFRQAIQDAQDDALLYFPTPVASNDPLARLRDIFARSSPSRHLQYITTPLILHHGEADDTVPIQWSVDLADALSARGKTAMLYTYPGQGHVFAGWGWQLFSTRTLAFFDEFLNPRASMITAEKRVLRQEQIALDASY